MQYDLLTDVEQLLGPCIEDAGLLSEKLTNDINRLLLGQDILLDPTSFRESIELYSEALKSLNEKHAEKGKAIAEVGTLMTELAAVVQENEGLIIQGVKLAQQKGEERESQLYVSTLQQIREISPSLEHIAIHVNVVAFFSLVHYFCVTTLPASN